MGGGGVFASEAPVDMFDVIAKRHLRGKMHHRGGALSDPITATEDDMVRQALLVMQGVPTLYFTLRPTSGEGAGAGGGTEEGRRMQRSSGSMGGGSMDGEGTEGGNEGTAMEGDAMEGEAVEDLGLDARFEPDRRLRCASLMEGSLGMFLQRFADVGTSSSM